MAPCTTTQMNFRIDRALKNQGDRAFRACGLTPTDAVRRLWEIASQQGDEFKAIEQVLHSSKSSANRVAARLQLVEEGSRLFGKTSVSLGSLAGLPFDELKEAVAHAVLEDEDAQ